MKRVANCGLRVGGKAELARVARAGAPSELKRQNSKLKMGERKFSRKALVALDCLATRATYAGIRRLSQEFARDDRRVDEYHVFQAVKELISRFVDPEKI